MKHWCARLKEELDRRTRGYKTVATAILLEILVLLLRCSPKQMAVKSGTLPGDGGSLLKAVNALEKAPEKHFSLAQMAKLSGMCVSSFTKKFRILTGVSPTEYLISLRIEKAENLLLNILPKDIAAELTEHPDRTIARKHTKATVLFTCGPDDCPRTRWRWCGSLAYLTSAG